jgi:hypothetical protein
VTKKVVGVFVRFRAPLPYIMVLLLLKEISTLYPDHEVLQGCVYIVSMIVSLSYQELDLMKNCFWVSNGSNVKTKKALLLFFDSAGIEILLMQLKKRYGKIHFYLGFSICNFILGSKYWSNYR